MEEYRIPTIDEFIPGFKYEEHTMTHQLVIMDFGPIDKINEGRVEQIGGSYEQWEETEVPDFDSNKSYTEVHPDGTTWTWLRNPYIVGTKEQYLERMENQIKEGRIRVKNDRPVHQNT